MQAAFLLTLALGSTDAEADYRAAADAVLASDPNAAIGLLESLVERGHGSADVYFDLGIALEDAGRPIDALVAYERALAADPRDDEARHNLESLRAQLAPSAPPREALGVADAVGPWLAWLPTHFIGWMAAGLLALLGLYRGSAGSSPPAAGPALALALLGLVLTGLAAAAASDHRAVVTTETALLEGPDPRFAELAELEAGEGLRVVSPPGPRFVEVQRADGVLGHVDLAAVTLVQP